MDRGTDRDREVGTDRVVTRLWGMRTGTGYGQGDGQGQGRGYGPGSYWGIDNENRDRVWTGGRTGTGKWVRTG